MERPSIKELLRHFVLPDYANSLFLSFEGIEGAGKSTQILRVKKYLEEKKFRVVVARGPGGTAFGEKLRQTILEAPETIDPLAQAYLFVSDRAQLLQEVILKELAKPNTVVICDRYIDSTLAYQGVAEGLGPSTILQMHRPHPLNMMPHRTFYLKISTETSRRRQDIRDNTKDYFESKESSFHRTLVEGYNTAAGLFPNRIVVIDGEKNMEDIERDIVEKINNLIEINLKLHATT